MFAHFLHAKLEQFHVNIFNEVDLMCMRLQHFLFFSLSLQVLASTFVKVLLGSTVKTVDKYL